MANHVKFADIKVGETYFVQSRYWHQVLGQAKITEIFRSETNPNIGECCAEVDWNGGGSAWFEHDWDWFWDAHPTDNQQRELTNRMLGWDRFGI